jgi:hypothetical protein
VVEEDLAAEVVAVVEEAEDDNNIRDIILIQPHIVAAF